MWSPAPPSASGPGSPRAGAVPRFALGLGLSGILGILILVASRSGLVAPEPTLLLRDRHGRFLAEIGAERDDAFGYWPLGEIPERVAAAVLAVEDRRFRSHPGVDPVAVVRALHQNLTSGRRISGASTLAMQVARMQHPGPRSYSRKTFEALTALLLTVRHGRDAVLAHYLRLVPYGNRIHGIGHAARRYLDKPVEDLSWAEIAFLCAIPQAPARMNPFHPVGRRRAVERGQMLLAQLHEDGKLTDTELALARRQLRSLRIPPAESARESPCTRCCVSSASSRRPGAYGSIQAPRGAHHTRPRATRRGGVANAQGRGRLEGPRWTQRGPVVIARDTSEVLAWVGSADYFDDTNAGAIDYTGIPRSPGSALKPFVYALALDRGVITPATILDDLERGAGGITNADGRFLGPLLPRVALANSRNVPAADLLSRVGLGEGYAFLGDLGLHDGSRPARRYGLGLTIGGMPVTLEQLVRAYGALASGGVLSDLVWWPGQERKTKRVLSEDSSRLIALFLSDPMARLPSFPRMGVTEYPYPVAVKTGTSSRFRDAWAMSFTQRYLVGVWVGDPDSRPMNRLSGYRTAALLVQRIVSHLHQDQAGGLEDLSFPKPRGFEAHRLCALTGRLATDACDRVFVEWLRPGEAPMDHCPAHVRLAIDTRTGRPASSQTPALFREVRAFVDLPARYAAWASAAGLPRLPTPMWERPIGKTQAPLPPALDSTRTFRLSLTSPEPGQRLLRDPEMPPERSTIALKAVVDPPVPQVVWYVDGAPFQVADYPYEARWTLRPGEHRFQARLPYAPVSSAVVSVVVQ